MEVKRKIPPWTQLYYEVTMCDGIAPNETKENDTTALLKIQFWKKKLIKGLSKTIFYCLDESLWGTTIACPDHKIITEAWLAIFVLYFWLLVEQVTGTADNVRTRTDTRLPKLRACGQGQWWKRWTQAFGQEPLVFVTSKKLAWPRRMDGRSNRRT